MSEHEATPRPLALITGASSGIGRELALQLARKGHDLVLTARRAEALQELASQIASTHSAAVHVHAADLADPAAPEELVRFLDAGGLTVDVLVNNAGFGQLGLFRDIPLERERSMVQVNDLAPLELTKRLLPGMVERGRGRVLNVASTAAFQPGPGQAVYYASKAFLLHWSEAVAEELRGTGVTLTALCPGATSSEFFAESGMARTPVLLDRMPKMSTEKVARVGLRGMERGRRIVVPGLMNRMMAFSYRLFPRRLVTRVTGWLQLPRG